MESLYKGGVCNILETLNQPDSPDNISFGEEAGKTFLKGASPEKLLQILFSKHKYNDPDFNLDFFLTHKSFMSSEELLQALFFIYQQENSSDEGEGSLKEG
jgi:hypothetical protein